MRTGTRHFLPTLVEITMLASLLPLAVPGAVLAAGSISLTTLGSPYTENFDTLASSLTSSTVPTGWDFVESGTNANTLYTAGTGSSNTGDTYSYGATSNTERAFGALLSGSLASTRGASFTNNTGSLVTNLAVAYTGEQWRLGTLARTDRIDFQYSLDATSLATGTWTDVDTLDFTSPTTGPTIGALDGNATANRTAISGSITSLAINNGSGFWIRWNDFNGSGADDGDAIDDFSLTPTSGATNPSGTGSASPSPQQAGLSSVLTVTVTPGANPTSTGLAVVADLSSIGGSATQTFYDDGSTGGDVTGGDNVFTFTATIDSGTGEGAKSLPATITDAQARSGAANIPLTVYQPCGQPATFIHDVQGNGASSPIVGSSATVEGLVVGDYQGAGQFSGYYVEEQDADWDADPATSEGVFVFNVSGPVNVGDQVRVRGTVTEFASPTATLTELTSVAFTVICSTGNSMPGAASVTLPVTDLTDFERYEGMLANLPQSLVISEYFNYARFGEVVLALPLAAETRPFTGTAIETPGAAANARNAANVLRRITLDDGLNTQNPVVLRHPNGDPFTLANYFRGGDTVTNAVGVLTYGFGLYRIQPTAPATYASVNSRPSAPASTGGRLVVAAQNTLNFFLTLDTGGTPCGPTHALACRGANTTEEFTRQRDKLIATLIGLNADVIGLNELENTGGVDPIADANGILAGLNAYYGAGAYDYINTGTIGTDAIKVGLVYRTAAVTRVGAYAILNSSVDPRFIDTKSRPVLAQTFMENATGEKFTVAVNHLKSKGSACGDVGDPDLGDGQGNCNGTRTQAAAALVDWLATDPTSSGDPDFLIIGDLNSYAMEDPISTIKAGPDDTVGTGDDYTNLVRQFIGTYAYSYVFDGQSGYLDHALSSATLTGQVSGVAEWHINSDESNVLDYDMTFKPPEQEALYEPAAYRSSDHDGVIVGLNMFGPSDSITINAGDNQSTAVNTDFATQLSLTVYDSLGQPVPNTEVTFSGPLSGASASIVETGPYMTDGSGNLVVTAHANATAGAYDFVATSGGATATFHLTNTAGGADHITINAGDNQSAAVNSNFPTQLSLTVYDADNNPVPNATVTFAGPLSGASASIVEAGPYVTDANGNLVVTAKANAIAGSYNFVASSGTASATFHLTNLLRTALLSLGGSSCAAYANGTATPLTELRYSVKKGAINGVNQGTFSYWIGVTATSGSTIFTINESITTGNFTTLFTLATGSNVFKSDCTNGLKPTISQASGAVTVTFNAPSAGTYYLGIKFSTSPIKGKTPPSPTTVHYEFTTAGVSDSTRGFDLIKQ